MRLNRLSKMEALNIAAAQFPATPTGLRRWVGSSYLPNIPNLKSVASPALPTRLTSQNYGINPNQSNRMFILGMGYVAQFFAQELKNQGWEVSGTCMSNARKKELEHKGFDVHIFNAYQPEWKILDILRCYTHLLISIPPADSIGDPMLQHEQHLKNGLLDGNLQWLCYLSSTSVYGDSKGAWVDEDSSPQPSSNIAKMRLNAEEGWLNLGEELGLSSYVFRLGGIYGPGRSAIDTILKKDSLSESQKRRATRTFTSRVHVADICQALRASISMQFQRKVYNLVDDDPAPRAEVFELAQQLIERRWPGLIDPSVPGTDTTYPKGGQKRVSNGRVKKELGVSLLHPSYKSGLQSIIDQMEDPISYCCSKNTC